MDSFFHFAKLNSFNIGVKLSFSKTGLTLPSGGSPFLRRRWKFAIFGSPTHDDIGASSNLQRGNPVRAFFLTTKTRKTTR